MAGAAAPCFTKGEKIFPMDLKNQPAIISSHNQSKTGQSWSLTYPTCSLRRELSKQGDVRVAIFNKCASVSVCDRKVPTELRDADLRNNIQLVNQRNIPVAIFDGTHDKMCPFDCAKVMNKGIGGSRLIELNESGAV